MLLCSSPVRALPEIPSHSHTDPGSFATLSGYGMVSTVAARRTMVSRALIRSICLQLKNPNNTHKRCITCLQKGD